jgi:hypothetical protein
MFLVVNNEVKIPFGKTQINLDKIIGTMVSDEAHRLLRNIHKLVDTDSVSR